MFAFMGSTQVISLLAVGVVVLFVVFVVFAVLISAHAEPVRKDAVREEEGRGFFFHAKSGRKQTHPGSLPGWGLPLEPFDPQLGVEVHVEHAGQFLEL